MHTLKHQRGFHAAWLLVLLIVFAGAVGYKLKAKADAEKERAAITSAVVALQAYGPKWSDAFAIANSTGRIALAGPVAKLQEIRRAVADADAPLCLQANKRYLAAAMQEVIDGFLQFMAQSASERQTADRIGAGSAQIVATFDGLGKGCAGK